MQFIMYNCYMNRFDQQGRGGPKIPGLAVEGIFSVILFFFFASKFLPHMTIFSAALPLLHMAGPLMCSFRLAFPLAPRPPSRFLGVEIALDFPSLSFSRSSSPLFSLSHYPLLSPPRTSSIARCGNRCRLPDAASIGAWSCHSAGTPRILTSFGPSCPLPRLFLHCQ